MRWLRIDLWADATFAGDGTIEPQCLAGTLMFSCLKVLRLTGQCHAVTHFQYSGERC